jgi:hypothetical protein
LCQGSTDIKLASSAGISEVVDQQFELARQILAAGLVPIIEPEIDIENSLLLLMMELGIIPRHNTTTCLRITAPEHVG